jgi:hypothetical protein
MRLIRFVDEAAKTGICVIQGCWRFSCISGMWTHPLTLFVRNGIPVKKERSSKSGNKILSSDLAGFYFSFME